MSESKPVTSVEKGRSFLTDPLDWLFMACVIGLAPLLVIQSGNLWSRQHLQFFPFAWLAFACLVVFRGQLATTTSGSRWLIGISVLLLSFASTVLSVIAYSPWLAQIAFVGFCLGWLFLRQSSVHWFIIATWIGILAITVPLPMNLDERLIQKLQSQSSGAASSLLDLLNVTHLLHGNIVEIESGKLFVDQACSGVDSLYALAAVTLMFLVWQQRGLTVTLLALVFVPLWAWFGNVLRLVLITYALDKYNIDLRKGWQHTLLGLSTFAIAFVCLTLTQEMIFQVLHALRTPSEHWIYTAYNWLVRWPMISKVRSEKKSSSAAVSTEESPSIRSERGFWKLAIFSLALVGLILGVVSFGPILSLGPWKKVAVTAPTFDRGLIDGLFEANDFPSDFLGLKRQNFRIDQRKSDDLFGEFSTTWYFASPTRPVVLSLDFPFAGFHTLEVCYQLTGHQVVGGMHDSEHLTSFGTQFIREGMIEDQFGESSYIYYMEFTASGKADKATQTVFEKLFPRQAREPLFQAQLYVRNATGITDAEHSKNRQILLEAQKTLLPKIQSMKL